MVGSKMAQHIKKRFSDLPVRMLSGAIYLAAFLTCLFFGRLSTAILIAAVSAIGSFELFRLMRISGADSFSTLGIVCAALYPFSALIGKHYLMLVLTFILVTLSLLWYVVNARVRLLDVALTVLGPLYTGMMLSSFVLIRDGFPGMTGGWVALVVFGSVVMNDTCAYLVGSRFGSHKLVPRISPNKSWEGFWGGLLGSVVVWCLLPLIPEVNLSVAWCALIGAVCGVVGLLGDLTESRIKRGAGVKDAGKIMPGHGGILDRVDSLIMVSFAAYFALVLAGVL